MPAEPEKSERLAAYRSIIEKWCRRIPLISRRTLRSGEVQELISSSIPAAAEMAKEGALLLDVGSGAGIPAIPIVLQKPDLTAVLVESNAKKAEFLREVARILELKNVSVVEKRFEEAEFEEGAADYITVRALRIEAFEPKLYRILKDDGILFLWEGKKKTALDESLFQKVRELEISDSVRILVLRKKPALP